MPNFFKLLVTLLYSVLLVSCGGGSSSTAVTYSAIVGLALDNYTTPTKLYVANADKQIIQTVDLASNVVTTFAGVAGTSGSTDAAGASAKFSEPYGISLVGTDLFVADTLNHSIRKMTSAGVVTTLAGTSGTYGSTDGTGTAALFNSPKSLAGDATYLYVADTYNQLIRKITISSGYTATFAGYAGATGTTDGAGSAARFSYPFGVAMDTAGNLFVTDAGNHTIRKITSAGVVSTFAGVAGTSGSTDDTGTAAKFNTPAGIVADAANNLFVVDSGN